MSSRDSNSSAINKFPLIELSYSKQYTLWRLLLLFCRQYDRFYSGSLSYNATLPLIEYDIIIAHDLVTVPLAFKIKENQEKTAKIIIDLHEYLPSQRENSLLWRWFYKPYVNYMSKKYLPIVNGNVTVNTTIAQKYAEQFSIPEPAVVRNIPKGNSRVKPSQVSEDKIKLVHHGVAFPSRGTEEMIKMMEFLDPKRFELYFILVNKDDDPYFVKLKKQASKFANIHFMKPVSFDQIVPFTNQFDIGIFLLPPLTYNYQFALPNKFFEYLHACLAIAIGPSPEMKKLVDEYNVGVVSVDFKAKSLALEISKLSKAEIENFKNNAHSAAQILNADEEMTKYTDYVKKVYNS
jgi:hypothetical protein